MGCVCESAKKPPLDENYRKNVLNTNYVDNSPNNNSIDVNSYLKKLPRDLNVTNEFSENPFNIDINKRNAFISNFFNKSLEMPNQPEKRAGIFIKTQKKTMKISQNLIYIEVEIIITANLNNPQSFYDNYSFLLDCKANNLKSKEIYVDDKKLDDSNFEINDSSIKIKFEKIFNGQSRKIKLIQIIEKEFNDYTFHYLVLNEKDVFVQFLIYGDDNTIIDDISYKNYILNKELNLAYFQGKTSDETFLQHGFINYSKKINYQIYKYIPELRQKEKEIMAYKNNIKESSVIILGIFKVIVFTEYGQQIDELFKVKLINYNGGTLLPTYSFGLILDIKYNVDLVELNGKPTYYSVKNSSIEIINFGALNNQYAEFHMKYRYITNSDKIILRKEGIITSNTKNTYCKIKVIFPDNYDVISSKEVLQKHPRNNNIYFYNGISNVEKIEEYFQFCFKKASWAIYQESTLNSSKNIQQCDLTMNRIYKGGNLKENLYQVINENGEYIDDINGDKFIFNYKDLKTNRTTIKFNIKVENSTSNYKYIENKDLITKIPEEDKIFFKNLSDNIIRENKSNIPIYKKLGKWVYNNIKYDIRIKGKILTAKNIYNMRSGVCEHFSLLYNTLLVSQGIDAVFISGYALDMTENNIIKENEYTKQIPNEPNTLSRYAHGWTLAKIDGEWIPLDATWNMFEKKVPVTHIFENYGKGNYCITCIEKVDYKTDKEMIQYIKN